MLYDLSDWMAEHKVLTITILLAVVICISAGFAFNVELTAGTKLGYIGNDTNLKLLVYHPGEESDSDKVYELQPSKNGYANQGWMMFMNLDPAEKNYVTIRPSVRGNKIFMIVDAEAYRSDAVGMEIVRCPFWQRGFCFWLSSKVTLVNPNQLLAIAR